MMRDVSALSFATRRMPSPRTGDWYGVHGMNVKPVLRFSASSILSVNKNIFSYFNSLRYKHGTSSNARPARLRNIDGRGPKVQQPVTPSSAHLNVNGFCDSQN